jgi:DNA-directed RNA polymerase subunit beta'
VEDIYSIFEKPKNPTEFEAIRIKLASPEKIRAWSYGEVKKPETINYRTFKPERDGLFCAKIFGPVKDWECICGKYKRMKHRGVVCDKCGVEVIQAKSRRERLGNIELATPVAHIWFLKGIPSRIGTLLDMTMRQLEKVLYFESYIVVDPGDTKLKEKELLSDEEYRKRVQEFGDKFKAGVGAEAVKELLRNIDLDKLAKELRAKIQASSSLGVKRKLTKRLRVVEAFRKSGNKPEWMIMDVIPVLPPDLRPLVPLEGGRFATSDLNDLYRRVINRNNRLKRLMELNAPSVIIRNEKRMLQESVDALFDNGRRSRVLKAATKRPLKSLSDMIKGKQGRFRQNLLGKRVDYSGRSVIVVGPELKLHQCGLPKTMALELFKPYIFSKLEEKGYVTTIKAAKKIVERGEDIIWDCLDEVIREHPVMLNRAPTLHRLGMQAFDPILVEGKAIRLHPLVCTAFNADFDGDQMAVHVPLSIEAQVEARVLMMSINNILSPASGKPIATPTQDMVLGIYYLTKLKRGARGGALKDEEIEKISDPAEKFKARMLGRYESPEAVRIAFDAGMVDQHAPVRVRMNGSLIDTTAGRIILGEILPEGITYDMINKEMTKKEVGKLVEFCYKRVGKMATVIFLDEIEKLGFASATSSGNSICIDDMHIPSKKSAIIKDAEQEVVDVQRQYADGLITNGERYNKVVDIWAEVTENIADEMMKELGAEGVKNVEKLSDEELKDRRSFNSVFMMADSGARGSAAQLRQLAGMRGLMAKPSGEIIETPITANFREGLTPLQYFISTHGARKGLADTALKTANSGYLTRRLVDVTQDVIIREADCGTHAGITVTSLVEGGEIIEPLEERVFGRIAAEDIKDPVTDETIVSNGQEITDRLSESIIGAGIDRVLIRSVLTCESRYGVCKKCYGRDLGRGGIVEIGDAVGIMAAQSIGEPGTDREGSLIVMNRNGGIAITDAKGREREKYSVVYGAKLKIKNGQKVDAGQLLVEWDPYSLPIITEVGGRIALGDIVEGVSVKEEVDEVTGLAHKVIIEYPANMRPRVSVKDEHGKATLRTPGTKAIARYLLPSGSHVLVDKGTIVHPGDVIAKIPRETTKTKDITGGLPRVAELFEARKPKEQAIVSEIDGVVEFKGFHKGMRVVHVKGGADTREYLIPKGKHLSVHESDWVRAGEALMDGSINPHNILEILGPNELQRYLVDEVQKVYRLQGVSINDKHIEVVVRQMMKKVKIEDSGDTDFLVGEQIDKLAFEEENRRVVKEKGKPAQAKPILLGITKASLSTDSFISAASFQETTRVLTEAAINGAEDELRGLKENIIMGRLIPAGTGTDMYKETFVEMEEGFNNY